MGQVVLPTSGLVYLDAQILIYSVERRAKYAEAIQPLWDAVKKSRARVVTSKLSILECLVVPVRNRDASLIERYETLFASPDLELEDVSEEVLRDAAELRGKHLGLRSPDAIHAATAIRRRTDSFLTNDRGFASIELAGFIRLDLVVPDEKDEH